ncbi:LamG domain-containing protein [Emticicia sp. 17c]|uniref:LamG domain-containing protein n=1 Tax=Emticicia sp. 17c TaxID=3127704 RepID=UPI00301CBDE7
MNYLTKISLVLIVIIINTQISLAQAPTNGLLAYYPFNNSFGNDESGNNRHGTVSGGVYAMTDRFGNPNKASYFDGTGSIIAPWNILTGNAARTMSVWFKCSAPSSSQYMLSWGRLNAASAASHLGTYFGTNGIRYLGFLGNSNDITLLDQFQYYDNRWHLMTFTYDGSLMSLYLDGVRVIYYNTGVLLNTSNTSLVIGFGTTGTFNYYYTGSLDDIRVYNRALTPTEIQQMYLAEVAPSTTTDVIKLGTNSFINTKGEANTFIGINSGRNTTGANNTFLGNNTGTDISTGLGNIFIGSKSNSFGSNSSILQRSGAIGYNARVSVNDAIVLGDFENPNIKVGIGVHDPQYRLDVKGVINMRTAYNSPGIKMNGKSFLELNNEGEFVVSNFRVRYTNPNEWPDTVFSSSYKIQTIEDVAKYARENKHLPNIPTAEEVVKNGVDVPSMIAKLLKNIEEQTLYIDKINSDYKKLQSDYQNLQKRVEELEKK